MRSIPKAGVMLTLLAAAFTSLLVFGISSDALSADSPLTHNSNRFGICKDSGGTEIPALSGTSQAACTATSGNTWTPSTKWSGNWGWSTVSQYGEFVCETCHERGSDNIKNVKKKITAPTGTFPPGAWSSVNFQSTTGFGDDTGGHATSTKVCEVCHSQTDYHRFNTAGQTVFNHNNNTDCIVCHKHNVGFKQLDCNACHGNPPTVDTAGVANGLASFSGKTTGSATAGKHATHATTLAYVCDNCHSNSVMPVESSVKPGFWDISIGFSNFGSTAGTYSGWTSLSYNNTLGTGGRTCSTVYCHGSTLDGTGTSPTWTGSVACGDCHKANAAAMATSTLGNHARHAGSGVGQMNLVCSDCHGTAGGQGHVSGKIEWSLNTSSNKFGPNAKYWGSTSGAAANRAPSGSYQSCSSVYCHSNVQTTPPGGALTYGTPQWGAGSVTCSTAACHGGDTDPKIASGSHSKHVSSPYNFVCATCHNNAGKNTSKHADRNVDVAFSSGSGSYNGTAGPGDAYGSCSSVYCHSSVQADGGVGAGTTRTATWNGAVVCGDCHSIPPSSGRHAKHADIGNYGFDCWACHNNAGINKGTGIPTAFHANGIVNMSIDATYGATATYSLGSTAPGDGYGTCATTYCHSAGTGGTANPGDGRSVTGNTSPVWSGTTTCDSCHAGTTTGPAYASGSPKANSHDTHVVSKGQKCVDCHSSTVNASNAIIDMTKHSNKLYDVAGAKITSYTYAADGGTCANSCHSSGTPKWGGTVACGDCHAVPPTSAGHLLHTSALTTANAAYGGTTDASTTGAYGFNCGNCHPFATSSHGNGTVEVSVAQGGTGLRAKNDVSAAYTGTIGNQNGTCSGVYCHSDGSASPAFATTPAWNTTFAAVGGDACAKCHGNSPNTNAHAKHVVGIHYYNIYTGTVGLATPGSAVTSSHGNATASTTINCNVCHNNTVTSSANDLNTVCVTCHTAGNLKGNAVIASRAFHVNGTADVFWSTISVKSKAQIRDDITTVAELNNHWVRPASSYKNGATPYDTSSWTTNSVVWDGNAKTCGSVACHNGITATWNSSPISCGACHTSLTN